MGVLHQIHDIEPDQAHFTQYWYFRSILRAQIIAFILVWTLWGKVCFQNGLLGSYMEPVFKLKSYKHSVNWADLLHSSTAPRLVSLCVASPDIRAGTDDSDRR